MRRFGPLLALPLALVAPASAAANPGDESGNPTEGLEEDVREAVVEFHFKPVPDLQIAIWIEDEEGNHFRDVFVTQATGTLGIGNRSGRPDFLSSWRFPYGPRPGVLPVWAHRRGKTYPKIIFHDDRPGWDNSLGWHEAYSSAEPYFCRPLTEAEQTNIFDVMSCPSPGGFSSDKGRFDPEGDISYYPPRTDLVDWNEQKDHVDAQQYATLNDLDQVTGATPGGDAQTYVIMRLSENDIPAGKLTAWIEVNLEHDENAHWEFDREDDHYVDDKLASYGVEWRGQPSVVYKVEFDPSEEGLAATTAYHGYGDEQGNDGEINSPDETISNSDGSGADRLLAYELLGKQLRFGVYSSGWQEPGEEGSCQEATLPNVLDLELEALDFDRARVDFTMPPTTADGPITDTTELQRITVYYQPGTTSLSPETLPSAVAHDYVVCDPGQVEGCDVVVQPGERVSLELDELWGEYTYQVAVTFNDRCGNESTMASASVVTPRQEFQQIDTFCFVATAAWGGNWLDEVASLRSFRDRVLGQFTVGRELVRYYYAYGPGMAKLIGGDPYLRATARTFLRPLADAASLTTVAKR